MEEAIAPHAAAGQDIDLPLIVDNHGTISHQHGVGKDHAPYLVREKGALAIAALHSLGEHFDPQGRLNPGTLLEQ